MAHLLKNPIFSDETKAREWLEARVWPNGPHCPHCRNADTEKITKLEGKAHRPGLYQRYETPCSEQFTVTVGTVFERSKIPLTKLACDLVPAHVLKDGHERFEAHETAKHPPRNTCAAT
jgi:transposase-like protein